MSVTAYRKQAINQ